MATIGKNQIFEIKNENGTSFQNLVLRKSTVESIVMSLGDKISGDVYYKDNTLSVTMHEYITYNGVNYVLVNPPTVVREGIVSDNSELKGMTKYSFEFYHPMYQLGNFPFCDVAVTSDETRYLSESKTFSWIGKPSDFVAKLNKNLADTEWTVELSSSFPQDKLDKMSGVLAFDKATIADACKTFYETWGVPYTVDKIDSDDEAYLLGKRFKIILGYPSNEIYGNASDEYSQTPFVFRMGQGVGLKNNSRTPRNNKIITRISGVGSENNIPYGYPQIRWYGTAGQSFTYGDHAGVYTNVTVKGVRISKLVSYPIYKGILGGEYVELIQHPFTRKNLMPSVYRSTLFNKISFFNENGNINQEYNPDITLVDYYDAVYSESYPYPNEINPQAPSYESHEFEDDKPELGEAHIISATPLNNDLTPAASWDDSLDDNGEYVQSYFQLVLPQLSFDVYACASITEEMEINMCSGSCLGCTFKVQVDWEDYKKNFYDDDGNFAPNGSQRDLTKYPKSNQGSISLVLQKDNSTFGTIMPSIYQYPVGESSEGAGDGDAFIILGISLPESYILSAEEKLDGDMKSYMLENNVYYFDYPLKFDECFLLENENILRQIRTSTIVRFDYAGQTQALYVKQLSIKYGNSQLPQYDITLTDNIEVVLNQVGQVAGDVNKLAAQLAILHQNYGRSVWEELDRKLSKTRDDVASGQITMLKGMKVGQYRSRLLGSGAAVDPAGNAEFESIYSRSFISTPEFRFNRISVTEGEQWCTNGYGTIESVVEGEDEEGNAVQNGGLITLHLEQNDFASVAEGDICRGIYNDIAYVYHTTDMDDDVESAAGSSAQEGDGMGFSSKGGFFTSYFYIERIVKNLRGECQFIYKLRSATTPHPCAFMKFAQYGSFTNADRRASSYATSIGHYYEMVLEGVRTWQIESANVVYRKGYLGNMVVELADGTERTLQGYGLYAQNNVYFGSAVIQLDPKTLEMLEDEIAAYDVNISGHVGAVRVDNHGYIIGGIYNDITDGETTTREYRIHSAVTVRKNGTLLTEALPSAEAGKGTYKITYTAVDCSCTLDDSTLYVTHIDNLLNTPNEDPSHYDPAVGGVMEKCRIDLVIDCEGKTSIQKSITIAINHDGQDGKGVEYIFITTNSWDGTDADKPTIYYGDDDTQVDDYCPYTDAQHTDQWTDEPTGVANNVLFEFYAQRKQVNGIWQQFGDVKLWDRYAFDGVTPYLIDLSNEQSLVACNENGGVVGSYETSKLILFYGQSYAFTDFAITITPTNITCNNSAVAFILTAEQKAAAQAAGYFTLTPSAITANSATIAVTATNGNIVLSAVYKVNKAYAGKNGVIYSLLPSLDTIRKNKSGTLVDSTLTLQVKKTVGATASILTTYSQLQNDGLSLQYQNADGTSALSDVSIATNTLIGSGLWGKINLLKSNTIVDSERLNVVVDGDDGAQGKYEEIEYAIGNNRSTAPSSGWSSSQPSPTPSNPYVWRRSRVYNPATGSYSGYTYVCLTGSTGATGAMYYPVGIHDPNKAYSVTAQLVPVACYNGSSNPQYYYAKKSVPENQNIPVTNTEYWGAFSNFAAAFIEVLFANFAKLGAFIVKGGWFISQHGKLGSNNDSTNYEAFAETMTDNGNNFVPNLAMNALNGYIYARRGVIGGFEIGDETLGTNYSSGTVGGTYIRKDGYMRIYNVNNYTGISVIGGAELFGATNKPVSLVNNSGSVSANGNTLNLNTAANNNNQVNIGNASNTQSVNINANAANFGSSTPVNIGSTLAVAGVASLAKNIISGSGTKTLPPSPNIGEFYFCKGTSGDMTIQVNSGTSHKIQLSSSGTEQTSISLNRDAHILVYMETNKWVDFKCN